MNLKDQPCRPYKKGEPGLDGAQIERLQAQTPQWTVAKDRKSLHREFNGFASYLDGATFLSAVAAMADGENHHPDLSLGYKRLGVTWSTHSVGGLSENDFICAAKVDALWGARRG